MKARQRGSGQALVEFILVLPLFIVLLLGLIDFGRVIWAQNAIRMNAERAARYASVTEPLPDAAQIRLQILEKGISPAVSDSLVEIITSYSGGKAVVVDIRIQVPIVTPLVSQIVGGSIGISAKAEELIH